MQFILISGNWFSWGCLAVLAILIACFGMLAMSHYDTQARTKEIGVRKVFGANAKDVVLLFTTDFAKIIGVGITIGIPLAIYLNSLWLHVFANKTGFSGWLIATATILTFSLILISIGWQTYSTALMNPVKSLRSE
ncbi:MAG: FtsX-like permease family protein [Bacteroidetes bacterium]|nr:FtsX-like permease family protein [Bacteroidota bacterium]